MAITEVYSFESPDGYPSGIGVYEAGENNWVVHSLNGGYRVFNITGDENGNYNHTELETFLYGETYDGVELGGDATDEDQFYREFELFEINGGVKFVDVNTTHVNVFALDPLTGDLTLESSTPTSTIGAPASYYSEDLRVFVSDDESEFRIMWEDAYDTDIYTMKFDANGAVTEVTNAVYTDFYTQQSTDAYVDDGAGGTISFYLQISEEYNTPPTVSTFILATPIDTATGTRPNPVNLQTITDTGTVTGRGQVVAVRLPQQIGPDRTYVYVPARTDTGGSPPSKFGISTYELFPDGKLVFRGFQEVPDIRITPSSGDLYIDGDGEQYAIFSGDGSTSAGGTGTVLSFNADGTVNILDQGNIYDLGESAPATIGGKLHTISTRKYSEPNPDSIIVYSTEVDTTEPEPGNPNLPCFAAETQISTRSGTVAAGSLKVGDKVLTIKRKKKRIIWAGKRRISKRDMTRNEKLCPVRITKNALGPNMPSTDLLVSRQHRILVPRNPEMSAADPSKVLVPAIKLRDVPGIFVDDSADEITYVHFLLEDHSVVLAENAPAESLYLGPWAIESLGAQYRAEIEALFPELMEDFEMASAYPLHDKRCPDVIAGLIAAH